MISNFSVRAQFHLSIVRGVQVYLLHDTSVICQYYVPMYVLLRQVVSEFVLEHYEFQ